MIRISDEILAALRSVDYSPLEVDIRDSYQLEDPALPMITVDELPGNDGVYLDNQPVIVTNTFTVEVYAAQMMVDGFLRTGRSIAFDLIDKTDEVLNRQFGLTMNGTIAAAPYTDQRVFRAVARYTAHIDTRNGTILRSL